MVRVNNVKEYAAWSNMIRRCSGAATNKKHQSYIRRGITVSEEFKTFAVFLEHIGTAPSQTHVLDRIDNDGNYERGNVRWVTPKESSANRSNTKFYEYQGKFLKIDEIRPLLKCSERTFMSRIERGWDVEDAVLESKLPPRKTNDLISFNGKEMTLTQWAKFIGVSTPGLYDRLNKLGWSIERALTTNSETKKLAFDGKEMTIVEWAKHLGISTDTLYYRINRRKWSVERALTTKELMPNA
jgi:hypothetical protein